MTEGMISCEICGVRAKSANSKGKKTMANFPLDEKRCRQWIKLVGKENLLHIPIEILHKTKYVCKDHFDAEIKGVPSKNFKCNPLSEEMLKKFPCEMNKGCNPRKNLSMKSARIFKSKRILIDLKKGNKSIDTLTLKCLIRTYIHSRIRKSNGTRWTNLEKLIAFGIFNKSPLIYIHLQPSLALPKEKAFDEFLDIASPIQKIMEHQVIKHQYLVSDMRPGVIDIAIKELKHSTTYLFLKEEKMCALIFAKMELRKELAYNERLDLIEGYVDLGYSRSPDIATHALVFTLKNLRTKWNLTVAYYFVGASLTVETQAKLINRVITAVQKTGYQIITTVCDHSHINIESLNLLKECSGISKESHYLMVQNNKIFITFDVPRLFKAISNNFRANGEIEINGKKAKWSHILELDENNRKCLELNKIRHLNITSRKPQDLEKAIQLLSRTVSTCLKLFSFGCEGEKKDQILETDEVIDDLDRLFDCTNGPNSKQEIIKDRRENVTPKTNHVAQWRIYKQKLKSMRFSKGGLVLDNPRCISGYITTLTSLEDIWKRLRSKGCPNLDLRLLNQGFMERMFEEIRIPCQGKPSCHQFSKLLKAMIILSNE